MLKFAIGVVGLMLTVQASAQDSAIDQVRNQLTNPSGCTVVMSGLWATTTMSEQPSEIRIVDGKPSRGKSAVIHGRLNTSISVGQVVRVVAVSEADDPKNDLLRIGIQAGGIVVPIVFVFPKGSIQSMAGPQLLQQISTVLQPRAVLAAPQRALTITPPAPPPPAVTPLPAFVKWSEPLTGIPTKDVKAACESTSNSAQAICYAILASFQDAEDMAQDAQTNLFSGCIPSGTTAQQVKDAFLAETNAMPDQLLGPISIFYGRTLTDKFPCPKAPPAKQKRSVKK